MFKGLKSDIQAVIDNDPAACGRFVVWFTYPGLRAIRRHRVAHWLHVHGLKRLARIYAAKTRRKTGVDIHPAAKIGRSVFIDHGMGVVIGETAEVGDNVTIYQGVTLGGTGKDVGKRHPTIENNVLIASGAKILGPFTVGANSKIGANSVVLKEVPKNSTVVGIPGHVVKQDGLRVHDLDQNLPDPVAHELRRILDRIAELEKCHDIVVMSKGDEWEG